MVLQRCHRSPREGCLGVLLSLVALFASHIANAQQPMRPTAAQSAVIREAIESGFYVLSTQDVENYLNSVDPESAEGNPAHVCSVARSNLGPVDEPVLVASADYSGRLFCNAVFVIGLSGSRIWNASVDTWEEDDVSGLVKRPDSGSHNALIVRTAISDYNGGNACIATIPRIYDLKSEKLVDVSRSFPDFYRRELAARRHASGPSWVSDGKICSDDENDKLSRMAGISQTAGYSDAKTWMVSQNPDTRMKAADTFADIADGASLAELRVMERDPNVAVKQRVTIDLETALAHGGL